VQSQSIRVQSAEQIFLLALGLLLLLLSTPAAAASHCSSSFCRCLQTCSAERKSLDVCNIRCFLRPSCTFFTSKLQSKEEVAVAPTSSIARRYGLNNLLLIKNHKIIFFYLRMQSFYYIYGKNNYKN
jgi:hypothetical protein